MGETYRGPKVDVSSVITQVYRGSETTECDDDFPVKPSQANYEKGKAEIVDLLTSPSGKLTPP